MRFALRVPSGNSVDGLPLARHRGAGLIGVLHRGIFDLEKVVAGRKFIGKRSSESNDMYKLCVELLSGARHK